MMPTPYEISLGFTCQSKMAAPSYAVMILTKFGMPYKISKLRHTAAKT